MEYTSTSSETSHADVVLGKQALIDWRGMIDGDTEYFLHSRSRDTESACAESRHNTPIYQLHT